MSNNFISKGIGLRKYNPTGIPKGNYNISNNSNVIKGSNGKLKMNNEGNYAKIQNWAKRSLPVLKNYIKSQIELKMKNNTEAKKNKV